MGFPKRLGNLKILIYQDDHRGASPHTPPGLRPGPARGMVPLDPQKFGYFILHELPIKVCIRKRVISGHDAELLQV